jgi:hypothetical protein
MMRRYRRVEGGWQVEREARAAIVAAIAASRGEPP